MMKDDISLSQLLELLPAYVSGELEPQRILAVHTYLTDIHDLLEELDELEQNLRHDFFPMIPVPQEVKRLLIERVRADLSITTSKVLRIRRWRRPSHRRWRVASALIWLVVIISSFFATVQWQPFSDPQAQVQATEVESRIIAEAERTIHLASTDSKVIAMGSFYFGEQEGVLFLYGLSPLTLSSHQDYQLWLIQEEEKVLSLGLLELSNNIVLETVLLPINAQEYGAVGISIEPAGGSEEPTAPVVFWGEEVDFAVSKNPLHLVRDLMRQAVLQGE